MSVNTEGKLLGRIEPEDILNFIRHKFDDEAIVNKMSSIVFGKISDNTFIKKAYGNDKNWWSKSGSITFKYNNNIKMLFYNYSNINTFENLDYYTKYNLDDMVKSETTYISLGYDDDAVTIISEIAKHFGGWIDKNDCDDIPYESIIKNPDGTIKPVFHVSMNDVYKKFGGIVIIDKN